METIPKTRKDLALKESIKAEKAVFRGSFAHTVDAKGRISLPAEFRNALGHGESEKPARVVVTNFISDGSRCLEGFAEDDWREFEKRLSEKSRFDPRIHRLENYYLSRAAECVVDGTGRITLPGYLRTYAGIEREVTFTASIHGFRLWDTRVWEHIFQQAESELLENPGVFADLHV